MQTTSTDHWTLVIQRVGTDRVELWVGTLHPNLRMPERARVVIAGPDGEIHERVIRRHQWQRPFPRLRQRFFVSLKIAGLQPGHDYEVSFSRELAAADARWQLLRCGRFRTLPEQLPGPDEMPFTVGFGSCFFAERDGRRVAEAWQALYAHGADGVSPDISLLLGDQVYLDIGLDSLSLRASEIRERIAADYERHWRDLAGLLEHGGTWMLPDDHEFWNDYPFRDRLPPNLVALQLARVRKVWEETAGDGVARIQRPKLVEQFDVGNGLSFCLVDARSRRNAQALLPEREFSRVVHWARALKTPGVLVLAQPLLQDHEGGDRAWADYPQQHDRLLRALGHSGHDVVLMCGDAHFGRVAEVDLGERGGRLLELVASPLSGLTGLSGLASAVAVRAPMQFPRPAFKAWPPQPVTYHRLVSHVAGRLFSAYPKDRTREHFMTASFRRHPSSGVDMHVQAWRVRDLDANGRPRPDFPAAFSTVLR